MSIFGFLKNSLPSFEDDFVQNDEEQALENAPKSSQQCHYTIKRPKITFEENEGVTRKVFPYGLDYGVYGYDPRPL